MPRQEVSFTALHHSAIITWKTSRSYPAFVQESQIKMRHPFPDLAKLQCFAVVSSCWPNSHATVLSTERLHKGSKQAPCPKLTHSRVTCEGGQESSIAVHVQVVWRSSQGQELNPREPTATPSLVLGHVAPAWAEAAASCWHSDGHKLRL